MSVEPVVGLVRSLVENMRRVDDDWASFAMVLEFSGGEVSGSYGYVYSADGKPSATSARPTRIEPAVTAYMESYFQPDDALPVKILIQFDRTSGNYEVTFEDTDVTRWQVTPANIDTIREELRPQFA
ncbi:hypothetical protein ACI7YT_16565 [Microbacterium sp. M]|uniref:hypothetical protein n=1 Tax=Microbacterium sp. M TaxID=3377125 RepID=UPI003866814B